MKNNALRRILCLLLVAFMVLPMIPTNIAAVAEPDPYSPENFKGLVVKAHSAMSMTFYTDVDHEDADKITPAHTATEGDYVYYYFPDAKGYYCYTATRTGYYKVYQQVYQTTAESKAYTLEEVSMEKRAEEGWDFTYYYGMTDEYLNAVEYNMNEKWHTEVPLETPVFTNPNKAAHQMTTQPELETFIADLAAKHENMYIFSIGKSGTYGFDIPIVIFTKADLSKAKDLKEAALLLEATELGNVGYKAQMHGDEHAAGEGALGVIKRLAEGEAAPLLDKVNLYVIPRMNPDGAYKCKRNVVSTLTNRISNFDPNRDMLSMNILEQRHYMNAMHLLDPIAELDGHERQRGSNIGDNQIGTSWRYGSSPELLKIQTDMVYEMFDALEAVDLSGSWYSGNVNTTPGNNTRSYAAAQGRIHILMETRGIYLGNESYGVRTASHIVVALKFFEYCAEHADEIVRLVQEDQQMLIEQGKTYEETDLINLSVTTQNDENYTIVTEKNSYNGTVSAYTQVPKMYNKVTKSRVAPTAYIIPADLPMIDEILEVMDLQEMEYHYLQPGTAVQLQQYTGEVANIVLSEEQTFAFPNGAYLFRKDTYNSIVLSMLMEPDHSACDLVEQALITPENGLFPIYRYIHDLNDTELGIEYTIADPAPTGITGVDATSAGNDGKLTGFDAGKLYEYRAADETEYTKLSAGTTELKDLVPGTYYIRYQSTGDTVSLDAVVTVGCKVTVYLDSAKGSDTNAGTTEGAPVATIEAAYAKMSEIIGTAGKSAAGTIVLLSEYTLTKDGRYDLPAHSYPVTIKAKDKTTKLIFKPITMSESKQQLAFHGDTTLDHLTFHSASTAKYDYIFACGNKLTIGADLTTSSVRSSQFPHIAGGDYKTSVVDTDLTILGGKWGRIYVGSFQGGHSGLAKLTIDGATITGLIRNKYSGTSSGDSIIDLKNLTFDTFYCGYSGNFNGDMTLILRENVKGIIYTGNSSSGNMNGTATIVMNGASLSDLKLYNTPGSGNTEGTVNKGIVTFSSGEAVPVEGFDEIHIDTDTSVFLGSDLVVDKITGKGEILLSGHNLTGDGVYGMELDTKTVSLRANAEGLYFTGTFNFHEELDITAYGIALSVQTDKPVAEDGTTSLYTVGQTSVLVKDILASGGADMTIYARTYTKLSSGIVIYGDTVAVTFRQLVYAADSMWDSLSAAQQQTLKDLYEANKSAMASWNIPNIKG